MISVIIPVYNVASFLDKCIKSVICQTYQDWECIIVDDGSTDGSAEICDKWCMKDTRLIAIHQDNQGVSAARNHGIEVAHGEYIVFIDSDDWIEPSYLETMIAYCNEVDFVVSGQIRDFSDGKVVISQPIFTKKFSINKDNADFYVSIDSVSLLYAPHEKLYRTDIIKRNAISFKEGCSYGEDLMFNYQYLEYVDSIQTISTALYHYRMGDNTLSSKLRPNRFEEDYEQWKILESFYKRHGIWTTTAKNYLYKRLWGIVYDGIFLYPKLENPSVGYISNILSVPEIENLKQYHYLFTCAKWIKKSIIHRRSWLLYLYFKMFSFSK